MYICELLVCQAPVESQVVVTQCEVGEKPVRHTSSISTVGRKRGIPRLRCSSVVRSLPHILKAWI